MSDKLKPNDCLEIYESRVRLGFFLAGGMLLTLGALLMTGACIGLLLGFLGPPPTTVRQFVSPILALLIGVVGIIMFGSATTQAVSRLFGACHPVLFLTRDGFKDTRISSDWIPWSAILSLKDYRGKGLVLDVDPQFAKKLRLSFATRFVRSANRLFGYRGLWVVAFTLENTSTSALLDVMRDQMEKRGLTEAASGVAKRISLLRLVLGALAIILLLVIGNRGSNDCEVVSDPSIIISACSRIIDGNGETMHKRAIAFANRASAYVKKGDNDRAVADANEAIRLDPKIAGAYVNRAGAYLQKGDTDRAIADYNEAIRLNSKDNKSYFNRGLLNLYTGSVDKALADLKQASALAPNDACAALWLDIVGQRNKLPSRLPQSSAQLDMTAWPAPVVKLLMGQLTPGDLLAAADDPNASTKKGQVCEANFYTGELSLMKGTKDEATRLFWLASSDCPRDFSEWHAANAELKALGAAP